MKRWKLSLLTLSLFATISALVLFSACEQDPCTELKCKNGSACTEGFCRCPTGYEGAECEFKTSWRLVGTFVGYNHCGDNPALTDTLDVRQVAEPNIVEFSLRNNNPTETFRGVVEGYSIIVPDEEANGFLRKAHAEINGNDISLFIERNYSPGNKSVCIFNGARRL